MKYVCANCENVSLKWEGKCSSCGEWGTLEEKDDDKSSPVSSKRDNVKPAEIVDISSLQKGKSSNVSDRTTSSIEELDRVLGGGFVEGEVVLLTGEPGIGKSTLLLQMCVSMSEKKKLLYVSGEESVNQLYGRYERISQNTVSDTGKPLGKGDFPISSETELDKLLAHLELHQYDLVVVDSIQSLISSTSESFPGSITQVRNCGYQLVDFAKKHGVVMVVVGQINKSGVVAGPKVLEHMVDAVLHMESDQDGNYKILRALKNRFGSTHEIGVFKMEQAGMIGVENPSEIFLSEQESVSGSVIGAVVEGSRVVLLEVQALVVDHGASPGPLRRVANGIKRQRVEMLCAVMSRRGNLYLGDKDVFINVSGGVNVTSTSLDLAVCAAIKSSHTDDLIDPSQIYVGEVGLTGGIKPFLGIDRVISDASRLGYKEIVGPIKKGKGKLGAKSIYNVKSI